MLSLLLVVALAACSGDPAPAATASGAAAGATPTRAEQRLDAMSEAVAEWSAAATIQEAHRAAESARNLVVGPGGPLYGDADGDGTTGGESDTGLLPALDGSPGLADAGEPNPCVEADVLGGPWDDARARWDIMLTAIDEWAPDHNTFPSLPSHPQRVVGWATLTLASDDLDLAHEYAGHARLHVDVSTAAYEGCDA